MIKLCSDEEEIMKYRKLSLLAKGNANIPMLHNSVNIFSEARKYFYSGEIMISVMDDNENSLFYLINVQDVIRDCNNGIIPIDINYYGCCFNEASHLDSCLVNRVDIIVFEELEEYTFEMANFIMHKFPDKKVVFLDARAKYFGKVMDGIKIISDIYQIAENATERFLYVKSRLEENCEKLPQSITLIYSSLQVMNSLCWTRCVDERNATKNETVLLIDLEFHSGCGLGFIIRTVCSLQAIAKERGWLSVVSLTGENLYLDDANTDMWEQYFEQQYSITLDEAISGKYHVISLKKNHFSPLDIYYNPYFIEMWHRDNLHIMPRFNKETFEYFNQKLPYQLKGRSNRVLGAFIRGTDADKKPKTQEEIKFLINECQRIMQNNRYEYLFLATEDKVYFEAFQKTFGDKLLYIEQDRVEKKQKDRKVIGELLQVEKGQKAEFGRKYLLITFCLSKCNALTYNMESGGYYLAKKWKRNPYKAEYKLEFRMSGIDKLIYIFELIQKSSVTAIYGTGNGCNEIIRHIGNKVQKIEFCDKRAEREIYYICCKKVLSPFELINKYRNNEVEKIIVASENYAEEIVAILIDSGVEEKDIFVFKTV